RRGQGAGGAANARHVVAGPPQRAAQRARDAVVVLDQQNAHGAALGGFAHVLARGRGARLTPAAPSSPNPKSSSRDAAVASGTGAARPRLPRPAGRTGRGCDPSSRRHREVRVGSRLERRRAARAGIPPPPWEVAVRRGTGTGGVLAGAGHGRRAGWVVALLA